MMLTTVRAYRSLGICTGTCVFVQNNCRQAERRIRSIIWSRATLVHEKTDGRVQPTRTQNRVVKSYGFLRKTSVVGYNLYPTT